jgi:hypothetical protein
MERVSDNGARFWNVFPPAVNALALSLIASHAVLGTNVIVSTESQVTEAEHVVDLLQESNGPASVIADQQAEAVRRHEIVEWQWYLAGGGLTPEVLVLGDVAMSVARRRRQGEHRG